MSILIVLILVKIAKDRRQTCAWNYGQAVKKGDFATWMIVVSLVLGFIFRQAQPLSVASVFVTLLLWIGSYRLAGAIYRKKDLEAEGKGQL